VSDALAMLLAERDIARALAGCARAMDARDWAALDAFIAEEASADFGTGELAGRAAIVRVMRSFLDDCGPTQHLLGNLTIEVEGAKARSRCYVSDLHLGTGENSQLSFQTLGEYQDAWECRNARWWLVRRVKLNRAHLGAFAVLGPGPCGWSPQ
jgi:hypothetical protein